MPKRPTIALCLIVKNEADNLPKLFKSIEGCFDEIHITDTGSEDKTVEVAKSLGATVHHFDWVDDFSAARNYSFSHANTDFIMWLDGDDVLSDAKAFKLWRDTTMNIADYWLATYNYALNPDGTPNCAFARERVVRRSKDFKWKYFVHEGLLPPIKSVHKSNFVKTWTVDHKRTAEDLTLDRARNLHLFELHKSKLDSRMKFYYGKELFENNHPVEATSWLTLAASDPKLENHDRVLAIQYACFSYTSCNQFQKAIGMATTGLGLEPQRAEFHVIVADSFMKLGRIADAVPFYQSAKYCQNINSGLFTTPVYTNPMAYTSYPRTQLIRAYYTLGRIDLSKKEADECLKLYPNEEVNTLIKELDRVESALPSKTSQLFVTDDIVFTCPEGTPYEFDPEVYETKGIGGSETALVVMAELLAKKTGRPVKVFSKRNERPEKGYNGVEYLSSQKLNQFFSTFKPWAHIAWRHNFKVTDAPTFVWSHDLFATGMEAMDRYKKVLCLSNFHKNYVQTLFGIPEDKILVTRNGLDTGKIVPRGTFDKIHGRVVYSSSPDRGLERTIRVMDKVVQEIPDAELHVYYGFDNMRKMNMHDEVAKYERMIANRPWVKFRGNMQQKDLHEELAKAQVWLYPTNFEETFCITALEMLANKVYPIVRDYGALTDTLSEACIRGQALLIDNLAESDSDLDVFARATISAIKEDHWKRIDFDLEKHSWSSVAEEWLEWLNRLTLES